MLARLHRLLLIFTILLSYFLVAAEIDLIVPSFPEMQRVFGLSPFKVELLLGANLVAHCIISLWMGSLGDVLGVRKIILWGIGVFLIGSIFTLIAPLYELILFGRIIQGIGISAPSVLAYLVIANLYPVEKQQKIMGTLNGVVGLGMACAPIIGSYVTKSFGWYGNMVLLFVVGIVVFLLCFIFLPKDSPRDLSKPVSLSLRGYIPVLASSKARLLILSVCLTATPFFVFVGISPLLYIEELGVSLSEFGYYQGVQAFGFAVLGFFASALIKKFGNERCLQFAVVTMSAFCISALLLGFLGSVNPVLITLSVLCFSLGCIFPFSVFFPVSLQVVEGAAGRSSALVAAGRLIATAFAIQITSYFYNGTFLSLALSMVGTILVVFWCYYRLWKVAPEAWK